MAKRPVQPHPLDLLAQGDPKKVIALMLWKNRRRDPDLYVKIDEDDLKGFDDCVNYLKVVPEVMIRRPPAIAAQPGIPAMGKRKAVPAREEIPARPYVVVTLVEKGTQNAIRPIENNEEDFQAQKEAATVAKAREQGPRLAQRLVQQAGSGDFSLSDVQDAADALLTLARAS